MAGLSLSAKGAKSESDVASGKPCKGRFLMMVKGVDETMEKKDDIIVDFEVLAGNVPDQKGKILTEYFKTTPKSICRLTRLALCVGLLQPGEEKDVSFMGAVGRVLFVEVEDHSYVKDGETKPTESVRVSFAGMWSVGNPDVADLHQVPEIAAKIAELRGQQSQQPPAQTPPQTPQPDMNKWGKLL